MATERLLMRHIREILRLKWTLRRSHRETARSLGISAGAVASVVSRAKAMALTWDAVGTLSDDALSVLVPVLEDRLGWNTAKIRAYFDAQGFALREWDKVRTDTITLCPTDRGEAANAVAV